jgi:group I intron endonuclease
MNASQSKRKRAINVPAKPGVYRITNCVNGKVYIGMSVNMLSRSHDHRNNYKNKFTDTKLKKAFRKYWKDCFLFDALFVAFDDCELEFIAQVEEQSIAEYDSVKTGYNMLPPHVASEPTGLRGRHR